MKEIWSTDLAVICAELQKNSDEHVTLTLLGSGVAPTFVTIRSILEEQGQLLVEFEKPDGLDIQGEMFVFYRRDDQQLMRGFELGEIRQANRFFRATVPEAIFEVQRRQFPRIYVAEGSSLTFALKASRRILQAEVIDVSMEGAKIFGALSGVKEGSVITPLTLTLCFDDRRNADMVVNIGKAVVVREIRVREKVELSFHFQSKEADDLLEKYIDLRVIEQEAYNN